MPIGNKKKCVYFFFYRYQATESDLFIISIIYLLSVYIHAN